MHSKTAVQGERPQQYKTWEEERGKAEEGRAEKVIINHE
jgi:hypothetical protein